MSDAPESELRIEGMTCVRCAARVEKAMKSATGIEDAKVDLVRERALVRGDASALRAAMAAVEKAGYVAVLEDGSAKSKAVHVEVRGAVALAIGLVLVFARFAIPALEAMPMWVDATVATLAVFALGHALLRRGLLDLAARAPGMDSLITLGALSALGLAWASLVWPAHHGMSHGHSDASMAALILGVALFGKQIEARAKRAASASLEGLLQSLPRTARVSRHGQEADIPLSEVRPDDELIVGAFASVPVDGVVITPSEISVDESMLTGETEAVEVLAEGVVRGGTLNLGKPFRMRATRLAHDSEAARMARLVADAKTSKSPLVQLADKVSAVFGPVIIGSAVLTAIGWMVQGTAPLDAIRMGVAVLVVACPCALGLATPVAVTVALGTLSSRGILVRDVAALEALPRAKSIVLDKTGTLTAGSPQVVHIELLDATQTESTVLALAAAIEAESQHPIARGIFSAAMSRGLKVEASHEVEELPGHGIQGLVGAQRVKLEAAPHVDSADGATRIAMRVDDVHVATLSLRDALRPEAKAFITAMQARHVRVSLRSGDAEDATQAIARELGITDAKGAQKPEDKVRDVSEAAHVSVMLGDGVNDAGAMAKADVGIAVGARAALPVEAASIVLSRGDLTLVSDTFTMAHRLRRIVLENLTMAFAYNLLAVPFAAFGNFERIGGGAMAAVAMSASSLLVVLNALRLRRPPS
jgi:Cu+-exporting ATPase